MTGILKEAKMNLYKSVFYSLILLIAGKAFSVSSIQFFQQDEAIQHFVLEKDSEFRLFYHNSIILGDGARWDHKEKLTDTPCFHLDDTTEQSASSFRQHNPMLVSPCTEYVLEYMVKIDKIDGDAPFIEFILYDYNTDVIATLKYTLENDTPKGNWLQKQILFKTDYLTHEVIIHISSDIKGKCDVRFDKVYLKQISEPYSLMPTPIIVMNNQSAVTEHTGSNDTVFEKHSLPITRNFFRLSFDLDWENIDGNAVVCIDWIGDYGDIVGKDYCNISKIEGVLSEWNGIAARWKKERYALSDKASLKLDWYNDNLQGKGKCNIERVMEIPHRARFIQIRIVKGEDYNGKLYFNNLKLVAEY